MDAEGEGEFDVGGAAGPGDEDDVSVLLDLGERLVQVGAQDLGAEEGEVNSWQQGHDPWPLR